MSIKVLYVEDEVFLGKIVKETLESRGFNVVMEGDGGNVLQVLRKVQPDVCVLDIMLPNKSGFEIAEEIRKVDDGLPIIFLTAKTQTEDVVKGFQSGANDFIRKPFSMEELIVRIENALRIKRVESLPVVLNDVLAIGSYQLNLKRQTLLFDKNERKLSYRETELLKYLWLNMNNIIDRKDMLNVIWGNDSFFNSRNLDVYITKLRGYLKDDPQIEILTIKGVGYRFLI
jgi:DNA-binding response OmpR family regulator